MKKISLLFFLILSINAYAQKKPTASPTDKAKAAVRRYLSLTMKDYSSYRPVQWSALKPMYSGYEVSYRAKVLLDSIEEIKRPHALTFDAASARLEENIDVKTDSIYLSYKKELDTVIPKMKSLLALYDYEKSKFKKTLIGYSISHSYRGKNSYGAYVLGATKFYLTPQFKVEDTEDLNDDDEDS